MHSQKVRALTIALTLAATSAWAQVTNVAEPKSGRINSPYSRFGIGNLTESRNLVFKGMGGAANGYSNRHTINATNPASYSFLTTTAFEFSVEAQSNNIRIGDNITKSSTLSIGHLNLAFPLVKGNLAVNIGYNPISKVYYNSIDTLNDIAGSGTRGINKYNGEGGLNYGFLGLSGGIKGFSLGVNAGYLFGNIRNSSYFGFIDTPHVLRTRVTEFTEQNNYGGLLFQTGAMYRKDFKNKNFLSIGATATLAQKINATQSAYEIAGTMALSQDEPAVIDTIAASYDAKGTLQMPTRLGFGLHYGKENNYDIGIDYTYTDWKNFSKFDGSKALGVGDQSYRIAIGGEIIPNTKASSKQYFSHITYRLGAYMGKDYLSLKGTDIEHYGFTAGLQLPFRASGNAEQMGALNMGIDFGNRGTLNNGLAREFMVNFNIGLKINARWFERMRF
jgi:hypothetical protein